MSTSTTAACLAAVNAAAGRDLTEAEADRIFAQAQARTAWHMRQGMDPLAAAQRAGQELGGEMRNAAVIERRAEALNLLARRRLEARIIPGREYDSVLATLTGVQRGTERDLANSVDSNANALRLTLVGGTLRDLEAAGLLRAVQTRDIAFERDLAREMWRLRDPSISSTGNRHAAEAAAILGRAQEALRNEINTAGGWVGKQEHYITRQSHDRLRVRGDGSEEAFQAWRAFIEPRLDPVTFRDTADPAAFLRNVWSNLASGIHTTSTSETLAGFSGPGNLGKKVSQERVLHFRDADAWFDYNQQFGRGAVFDSVLAQIEKGASDVALMRMFGTNPEAMVTGLVQRLSENMRDSGRVKEAERLAKSTHIPGVLAVLDGRAAQPGNHTLAQVGANVRAIQTMARLGGVLLSSISDLPVTVSMLRHNGVPLLQAYARQMMGLLPKGPDTQQVARALGVGFDGMLGNIALRIGAEDQLSGRMARATNAFFKWNGLNWWTDRMKETAGLMLSSNLADNARHAFPDLNPRLQATLRRYGIEAAEWDQIRATPQQAADGRAYIVPEAVQAEDARRKVAAYIVDQVREGMTEPTAGTRGMAQWHTQRGTPIGEAVRMMMQFKTFPITYMSRTLGREMRRDGIDVGGVAHLIAATTVMGYLALTLKDFVKFRAPREPEDAEGYRNLVLASMLQGGGAGLYGDFLFGEANRFGTGLVASLAGPTAGSIEEAHKLYAAVRGEGNLAAQAIRMGVNHTPFVNLFYTRMALDYLVLWRLQEWANPGYLRRVEQRTKRENDQTFWLRPTEAVR